MQKKCVGAAVGDEIIYFLKKRILILQTVFSSHVLKQISQQQGIEQVIYCLL